MSAYILTLNTGEEIEVDDVIVDPTGMLVKFIPHSSNKRQMVKMLDVSSIRRDSPYNFGRSFRDDETGSWSRPC